MANRIEVPLLVGAKVKEVRKVTQKDCDILGVDPEFGFIVVMDNGIQLAALRDPEGNGLGVLVGIYKQNSFFLMAEKKSEKGVPLVDSPK